MTINTYKISQVAFQGADNDLWGGEDGSLLFLLASAQTDPKRSRSSFKVTPPLRGTARLRIQAPETPNSVLLRLTPPCFSKRLLSRKTGVDLLSGIHSLWRVIALERYPDGLVRMKVIGRGLRAGVSAQWGHKDLSCAFTLRGFRKRWLRLAQKVEALPLPQPPLLDCQVPG